MQHLKLPTNWHHTHLQETISTMLELQKDDFVKSTCPFELLTTDYQTAGRGQRGTSWEADTNANLLFGFIFHPTPLLANQQFFLSEALALAVRSALSNYTKDVMVKWPNDVYWRDKKICGMLLEHTLCGKHIATTLTGVGININQESFKSDAPNPISLKQITGQTINRCEVLEHIIDNFSKRYDMIVNGQSSTLHKEYMQHLYRGKGLYPYKDINGTFNAQIEHISPIGTLSLKREDGTTTHYAFKEVTFI